MAKTFPVKLFRSDIAPPFGEPRTFKRWALYLGNDHVADIEATAVRGYAPRVSILTSRGRVLLSKRGKAAR